MRLLFYILCTFLHERYIYVLIWAFEWKQRTLMQIYLIVREAHCFSVLLSFLLSFFLSSYFFFTFYFQPIEVCSLWTVAPLEIGCQKPFGNINLISGDLTAGCRFYVCVHCMSSVRLYPPHTAHIVHNIVFCHSNKKPGIHDVIYTLLLCLSFRLLLIISTCIATRKTNTLKNQIYSKCVTFRHRTHSTNDGHLLWLHCR